MKTWGGVECGSVVRVLPSLVQGLGLSHNIRRQVKKFLCPIFVQDGFCSVYFNFNNFELILLFKNNLYYFSAK